MQMGKSWRGNKFPRKFSKKETRLKKPSTYNNIQYFWAKVYNLPVPDFQWKGKVHERCWNHCEGFIFLVFPSELCTEHPMHRPWSAHHRAGGTHHTPHFTRVNCALWHEWDCSTDTVNHQFQGFGRMGITPHAAAALGTGRASDRGSTARLQPRSTRSESTGSQRALRAL